MTVEAERAVPDAITDGATTDGGGFAGYGEPPILTVLTVDDVEYSIHADPTGAPAAVRQAMSRRGSTRCPPRISPTTCPHHVALPTEPGAPPAVVEVQPKTNGPPRGLNVRVDPKWSTRTTTVWTDASVLPTVRATQARPRASRECSGTVRCVVRTALSPRSPSAAGMRALVVPSASVTDGLELPHAVDTNTHAATTPVATEGRGLRPDPPC